jgi:phospho-N-acetylmuramoyl-pentapeptide-transferase
MLYHLSFALRNFMTSANVMHYISFRSMAALLTALAFSLIFGDWFIEKARIWFRSQARQYTPESHKAKDNMPTMGGVFILTIVSTTILLWCNLARYEIWLFLGCIISFGMLGFWDDWYKIQYKKGISERTKFITQLMLATIIACLWYWLCAPSTIICFPFFKTLQPELGIWYIPWVVFLFVATSNAVNLTDGLDGLAIGSLVPTFGVFSILAYLSGHTTFAAYLVIPFAGNAEIAIVGAALIGASLGFLWFNTYPAQIFMGDVGSLALGAGLAFMALLAKQELLVAIAGGLFVVETLSVIAQVTSFRLLGKRIFKMAPLHHHFELLGWPESKITVRFGIVSLVLCLISLMTLKLR